MIRKMVIPEKRIAEVESEDTGDTDSVESYLDIAAIGDIDRTAPGVGDRNLTTDIINSKLVYFVNSDGSRDVALPGKAPLEQEV